VFLETYLKCWNGSEAARTAGYSHPGSEANRLLKNAEIQAEIEERLSDLHMSAREVLTRLAEHGRADMGSYLLSDGSLDLEGMKEDGMTRLIKKYRRRARRGTTRDGAEWEEENVEVELHDAQAALALLGKNLKLFTDRQEITGADGEGIKVRVEYVNDWREQ
jgi:hypothetical protein